MAKRELAKTSSAAKAAGKVQAVKEWLDMNYEIKINIFDHSKSYIESKEREYTTSITENDIYMHMIDDGLACSKSLLKAILTSPNQMTAYNPVTEYFDGLQNKWNGVSQIDLYCSFLRAHDFKDKDDTEFYQNRMKYLIKKWLVAVVAQVYGKRQNDVAIGFVNAQGGIGKTTLIEFLVPRCLEEYYVVSDKDERIFRMTECFVSRFIINFDEFV